VYQQFAAIFEYQMLNTKLPAGLVYGNYFDKTGNGFDVNCKRVRIVTEKIKNEI